jgi:hypothetical protein
MGNSPMGTAVSVVQNGEDGGEAVVSIPDVLQLELSDPILLRTDALEHGSWVPMESLAATEVAKFKGDSTATDMEQWNYNIWALDNNDLMRLASLVFQRSGIVSEFAVNPVIFRNFLRAVQGAMDRNANAYHSFRHVMDVMHSCYLFLETFKGKEYLLSTDRFAMIAGAVVHDFDHPGTNNTYHSNKQTRLAIVYNDVSILESYHCARTWELFSKTEYDVFHPLDPKQRKDVRRQIIMMVMATDMVVHFAMKADFDKLVVKLNDGKATGIEVTPDAKERDLILKVLLHAADVSNPTKQWDVCKTWSDHVIAEFFAQGDMEKEEGLPISMNCDRDTTFQDELSMNFSDFIVGPFYCSIANLLPNGLSSIQNLKDNRKGWFEMYKARVDADNASGELLEKVVKWQARDKQHDAGFDKCIKEINAKLAAAM